MLWLVGFSYIRVPTTLVHTFYSIRPSISVPNDRPSLHECVNKYSIYQLSESNVIRGWFLHDALGRVLTVIQGFLLLQLWVYIVIKRLDDSSEESGDKKLQYVARDIWSGDLIDLKKSGKNLRRCDTVDSQLLFPSLDLLGILGDPRNM